MLDDTLLHLTCRYPIMSTGNTVIKSVNVLKEHLVPEESIILANLFCTPHAVGSVLSAFPKVSFQKKYSLNSF